MVEDINLFEQYVFSERKSDFLNTLIVGTDNFYYFSLLHALNTYGIDLPIEHLENFENYKKFNSYGAQNIRLRFIIMKLSDTKTNLIEQKSLIEELNKNTLHYNFDFDEPRTTLKSSKNTSNQIISHILKPNLLDVNSILLLSYNNLEIFNTLEHITLSLIDIKQLSKSNNIEVIKAFLNSAILAEFNELEDLLLNYYNLNKNNDQSFEFESHLYEKLTLKQMKKLAKIIPNLNKNNLFLSELFIKRFKINQEEKYLNYYTPDEKISRKKHIMEMYIWSINLSYKFYSFSAQLLYELLQIGFELNQYDFELFIEYLKNPKKNYTHCSPEHLKQLKSQNNHSYDFFWHEVHDFNVRRWENNDKLIEFYLIAYFKTKKKIDPFENFFQFEYLQQLFNKVLFYEGVQIPNITEIFSPNLLQTLENEKIIMICNFNRECFSHKDDIALYVEIKNIPNMNIKVFEISLEDYYLKNQDEINKNINIEGLIANEEISIDFTHPPHVKIIKEFKFESITAKKQGVFIIEFIGFGIVSRAIIKKGKLLLVEKINLSGQQFTILDENFEICKKTRKTGLWIKNRFHEADDNGQINLPFNKYKESVQGVIIHNDFAYITTVQLVQESYDFKCAFLYNDENILIGNTIKILIQPRLFLNEKPVSLDIIKDPLIEISTLAETGTPSYFSFEKLNFDYKQELEIEFPILMPLKRIEIVVKGKIKPMNCEELVYLSNNHIIEICNSKNEIFCESYLKFSNNGYEIYVLGKNGEVKSDIVINFELKNKYLTFPITHQLQTDKEGKVSLGMLQNITNIHLSLRRKGDIKTNEKKWLIENRYKANYPTNLTICEGEKINLTYFAKDLKKEFVSFLQIIDSSPHRIIFNKFSELKLSKNMLDFSHIKAGTYILKLKQENHEIYLKVNKAKYFRYPNQIITKEHLLYNNKPQMNLRIENIEIKNSNNHSNEVELSFSLFTDDLKTTRIHIFAYHFLNYDINHYCKVLSDNIIPEKSQIIPNIPNKSLYFSNMTLNDEYYYVLNRKKEQRFIGNILQKPKFY